LVAGLIAGLSLPSLALALKDWLPLLIGALLFVSAYRIGPCATVGSWAVLQASTLRVLFLQVAVPLTAILVLTLAGVVETAPALAVIFVLSAPAVSGAPSFAILMGRDPTRAMQIVLIGTALFPLTVIPVLWALPAIPTPADVALSAGRLLGVIALAVGAAFLLRGSRELGDDQRRALDGMAALLLAVVVVGLMSAMGPALQQTPSLFALWLAFAIALNFGLQFLAHVSMSIKNAGIAIATGNRNVALFLVALPPEVVDDVLLFIGCYQVPMFLTPVVMSRVLRSG
ncbi:MAG: hypothetical protein AAF222_14045, partial [Pseudomonadota bacterium]